MTTFNRCPNCGHRPSGGIFGGAWFSVYECRSCHTCYCYKCGDSRCPECGAKERDKAGECWAR